MSLQDSYLQAFDASQANIMAKFLNVVLLKVFDVHVRCMHCSIEVLHCSKLTTTSYTTACRFFPTKGI